jgi:hypothetical protein
MFTHKGRLTRGELYQLSHLPPDVPPSGVLFIIGLFLRSARHVVSIKLALLYQPMDGDVLFSLAHISY